MLESLFRRIVAISSLDRVRWFWDTSEIRMLAVCDALPRQCEPPVLATMLLISGTSFRTISSTLLNLASTRSTRVPTSISAFTRTSPSSELGMSSVPTSGMRSRLPPKSRAARITVRMRWFSATCSSSLYPFSNCWRNRPLTRNTLWASVSPFVASSVDVCRSRAASMGTTVSAAARAHIREKLTTRASCLNMTPAMPRTKISGRKTTTVVRVLATIAPVTSSLPSTAASSAPCPDSLRR